MCRMCDDPSLTIADMRAGMFQAIAQYGWMVQYVEAEPGYPAFAYTVGLSGRGLPEVYVEGLSAGASGALLNDTATRVCERSVGAGSRVRAGDGRVYLLEPLVDVHELYGAIEVFGPSVDALQLTPLPQRPSQRQA